MAKAKVKSGEIFERKEMKYILTPLEYKKILEELQKYMTIDEYGLHTIHTVYFDTEELDVIRHSVSKPKFKEKLRLRSYGTVSGDSQVYLELKKKVAGITYKRRVAMTYQEAKNFLTYGVKPGQTNQIFKEIDWYTQQQVLQPIALISYDRLALKCLEDNGFRITFDHKIRYSLKNFELNSIQNDKQKQLSSEPMVLMEVKVAGAFPLEISRLFSKLQIFQQKFTKYGNVYQWVLFPKWEAAHLKELPAQEYSITNQEETIYV